MTATCSKTDCGVVSSAEKAALLIDNAAYFSAAADAIRKARHSIWLLGWEFDPRTVLKPGRSDETIGSLLLEMARKKPGLQIKVLIWKAALPIGFAKNLMPYRALLWFKNSGVDFRLDDSEPPGACLHQKLLVIDEDVAFCSGADFARNRWDNMKHAGENRLRKRATGGHVPPRHSWTALVQGQAARIFAEVAKTNWRSATGEPAADAAPASDGESCWPEVRPDFSVVPVCISRTRPSSTGAPAVRENEKSFLAAIAGARKLIHIENQYFTSSRIADALAGKLRDPRGPEIMLVIGLRSPSFFDRAVMDPARNVLLQRLYRADRFSRFTAVAPKASNGRPILVHSKLLIVDDRLLRVGSSNLSNRSLGYDVECDLTISLDEDHPGTARIRQLRQMLVGHFVEGGTQVQPIGRRAPGPIARLIGRYHLGDPENVSQAWRPWRRKR